ncbi:Stealth CR1 domain-containing protein [Microlunatus sp. GCM10028923]|uniref:stealth family protein n=1 Tax=Microlunatus sp. GCM10028923 TaxID=3273400 RepID=UPI003611D3AA
MTGRRGLLRDALGELVRLRRRFASGRAVLGRPGGLAYRRAKIDGLWVLARSQPELRLPEHTAAVTDRLRRLLHDHGIEHWQLPVRPGRRTTFGVRERDRTELLKLITALGPAWYAEPLRRNGDRTGRVSRPACGPLPPAARGFALWECCVDSEAPDFGTGEDHRVEVHFWREGPDGALTTQVGNEIVDRLRPSDLGPAGSVPPALAGRPVHAVSFPIDLVYTWVDGADPDWHRKRAAAGAVDPARSTERADDPARFTDHDELRHSLRSVEQFAPWINHIWIVTNGQRPHWLRPDDDWVTVVAHDQLWPDRDGLPTFNSHAIEACLHRIPGLAEHYLYLNDDMIIGRPVPPELFFHPNGIGKFFASRLTVDLDPPAAGEIASTTAAKNARRLLADRFGVITFGKYAHAAVATRKSVITALEAEFPDVFAATRRSPFRTTADVAAAGSFYLGYAYATGAAVPGPIGYEYVDPSTADGAAALERLLRSRTADAICLNDGHTAGADPARTDLVIKNFLRRYLPVPGRFEKD